MNVWLLPAFDVVFRPTDLRTEPRVELLVGPWCNMKIVQLLLRKYSESPDAPTLVGYRVSRRRVGVTLAATTRIDIQPKGVYGYPNTHTRPHSGVEVWTA